MAMSKGCTIALVVVGILFLLIIIGIVIVWMNKDKIVEASLDYMIATTEREIKADLPPGYTPESVHNILATLKGGIKSGEIDSREIQILATEFQSDMKDKKIDQEEGARILDLIVKALPPEAVPTDSLPRAPTDSLGNRPDSTA